MEFQEKKMELFKLAVMATLKEKNPADAKFDEVLWENYRQIEGGFNAVDEKLKKRNAERLENDPLPSTMV